MPKDLVTRINLDQLYPPLAEKLLAVIGQCRTGVSPWQPRDYHATRGFATFGEQQKLFGQGRTTPGDIVTYASGGWSAHNYGLAVDLAADKLPDVPKLQPDWLPASYDFLGHVAMEAGLIWGGSWMHPDRPHIQWPKFVTKQDLQPLHLIWVAAVGLPDAVRLHRVWDYVDKHS